MYEKKILSSILGGDASGFIEVGEKSEIVFLGESDLLFYNLLHDHFLKDSKIPSVGYLDDFFSLEKSNKARKSYDEVRGLDGEVSDDLRALVRVQIRYNVKTESLRLSGKFSDDLKLCDTSKIRDLNDEYLSNLLGVSHYLEDSLHKRGLLYGEESAVDFRSYYDNIKNSDRGYYIGKTGFSKIDSVIGGIHSVDKFTVLGFTNQGKSPFLRQIGYNLLMQGLNVMFVSLEMDFDSIKTSFYTLHANNFGVFGSGKRILSKSIREGSLSESEESFLFDEVMVDFNNNGSYGSLYILQPESSFSLDDLFIEFNRVNKSTMPVDALFIDYAVPLIQPVKGRGHFNTDDYNAMHRRLRLFGLSSGVPIFDACQANRAGFEDACSRKNSSNSYSLTAVGQYNSIEKDSTHIISVLQTDEMKVDRSVQVQHLKSRESELFESFRVHFDGATGVFRDKVVDDLSEEEIHSIVSEVNL